MEVQEARQTYEDAQQPTPPGTSRPNGMVRYALIVVGVVIFTVLAIIVISIYVEPQGRAILIGTVITVVAPVTAVLLSILRGVEQVAQKVEVVEKKVDGKLTKLLAATEEAALERGKVLGRLEEAARKVEQVVATTNVLEKNAGETGEIEP